MDQYLTRSKTSNFIFFLLHYCTFKSYILRMQEPIEVHGLPIGCIMSTSPQTEINDHPTSLGMAYGQHIKFPSSCLLSIFSWYCVGIDAMQWPKTPPQWEHNNAESHVTSSIYLKPRRLNYVGFPWVAAEARSGRNITVNDVTKRCTYRQKSVGRHCQIK